MWNRSENQMKFILIRHGATKSNKEHRYVGKTDESLSKEGISQLHKAKGNGIYPKVMYVFSSPMKRCIETSGILYPHREPVIIPEWEEMDFGAFEGKNFMDLQGDLGYQAWIDSNGTLPFPGGESRKEFDCRCRAGFDRMIEMLAQTSEKSMDECMTAAIIVHGGIIMSLLSQYVGGDYFDYQISNGGGYQCILEDGNKKIKISDTLLNISSSIGMN